MKKSPLLINNSDDESGSSDDDFVPTHRIIASANRKSNRMSTALLNDAPDKSVGPEDPKSFMTSEIASEHDDKFERMPDSLI